VLARCAKGGRAGSRECLPSTHAEYAGRVCARTRTAGRACGRAHAGGRVGAGCLRGAARRGTSVQEWCARVRCRRPQLTCAGGSRGSVWHDGLVQRGCWPAASFSEHGCRRPRTAGMGVGGLGDHLALVFAQPWTAELTGRVRWACETGELHGNGGNQRQGTLYETVTLLFVGDSVRERTRALQELGSTLRSRMPGCLPCCPRYPFHFFSSFSPARFSSLFERRALLNM
jgi:hypothetical protein